MIMEILLYIVLATPSLFVGFSWYIWSNGNILSCSIITLVFLLITGVASAWAVYKIKS